MKAYRCEVRGFDDHYLAASTAGKARMAAAKALAECGYAGRQGKTNPLGTVAEARKGGEHE